MEYELGLSRGQVLLAEGRQLRCYRNRSESLPQLRCMSAHYLITYRYCCESHRLVARAFRRKGTWPHGAMSFNSSSRAVPWSTPTCGLSTRSLHYDLSVLLERIGEKEKAKAEYEKFVRILSPSKGYVRQVRHARERLQELGKTSTAKASAGGST